MSSAAERFHRLFRGFEARYGRFDISSRSESGKLVGKARTIYEDVKPSDYASHVAGEYGIGVIPLTEDDRVHFSAIDVDKYDIDDFDLAQRVSLLPVVVTRSKSGGAHVWLFSDSGIDAALAVAFLKNLAGQLGHGKSEIFPKQTARASSDDVGNWINLPYMGDTRRAVLVARNDAGDAVRVDASLEQFLAVAEKCADVVTDVWLTEFAAQLRTERADADLTEDWYDGPPCVQRLFVGDRVALDRATKAREAGKIDDDELARRVAAAQPQLVEGGRNTAFFNAGTYLFRKYGSIDKVLEILTNINAVGGFGLARAEIELISKQSKKEFGFQCNEEPLCGLCQRSLCRRRKYGIGSRANDIPIEISGFTKIMSDPPMYAFNADGARVRMDAKEILNQRTFAIHVLDAATKVWPLMQEAKFRDLLQTWMSAVDIVDGPPDSDRRSIITRALQEFVVERRFNGATKDPYFRGRVWWSDDEKEAWFDMTAFRKFLRRESAHYEPREVSQVVQDLGGHWKRATTTIAGRTARPWIIDIPTLLSAGAKDAE